MVAETSEPMYSPFFGVMGATAAMVFSGEYLAYLFNLKSLH